MSYTLIYQKKYSYFIVKASGYLDCCCLVGIGRDIVGFDISNNSRFDYYKKLIEAIYTNKLQACNLSLIGNWNKEHLDDPEHFMHIKLAELSEEEIEKALLIVRLEGS